MPKKDMAPPTQGRRGLIRGTTLFLVRPKPYVLGRRQALLALTGLTVQPFLGDFSGATFSSAFPQGSQPLALLSLGDTPLTPLRH